MQFIMNADEAYADLDDYFVRTGAECILLVCGSGFQHLRIKDYFETLEERLGVRIVRFSDYQPNPCYDSVVRGVSIFRAGKCDLIAAVGGGSAMDVAKCIKLYANMDNHAPYLAQRIVPNDIPLLAIPTTAGTGSEATRFAVIYHNGEKLSVSDESCIPSAVLFDPALLKPMPMYQRKATMLDALCHAVESYWSVHATQESMDYARRAIKMIVAAEVRYLANDDQGNAEMMQAANLAGKAINITQTTAGHAMCYKLTTLYGIAHGHAAALCVKALLPYMMQYSAHCTDARGAAHLENVFGEIADALGCSRYDLPARFAEIVDALALPVPSVKSDEDFAVLTASVNPERLRNHPVSLSTDTIKSLYQQILQGV